MDIITETQQENNFRMECVCLSFQYHNILAKSFKNK